MFGFSVADWMFCGFILIVITMCVNISALLQKKKTPKNNDGPGFS